MSTPSTCQENMSIYLVFIDIKKFEYVCLIPSASFEDYIIQKGEKSQNFFPLISFHKSIQLYGLLINGSLGELFYLPGEPYTKES